MSTNTLPRPHHDPAPDGTAGGAARARGAAPGLRRWWLLAIAGVAAVLASLVWGLDAATGMVDEVEGWVRAEAPGTVEVAVGEPGRFVVRSEKSGFVRWGRPAPDLEVSVTDPDGETVAVADAAGAGQYRVPGRTGRAVATFEAAVAGSHRVTVDGPTGAAFAVGQPLWPGVLRSVVGAAGLGLTGLLVLAGGIVGLVVARTRQDGASTHGHAGVPNRRRRVRHPRSATEGPGLGRVTGYAVLVLTVTWAVWIPALTLLGERAVPFVLLGAFGPAVAAAVMVRAEGGRVRSWLRQIFRFRLPARWYVVALVLPLLEPMTVTVVAATHGAPLTFAELPARLPAVVAGLVVVLLVGGGQEELGWRGYLLPRLQARVGALGASLAIGVLWAVWHLPLFVLDMPGYTYEHVPFLVYLPLLMAASVAFTWVCNRAGGSVVPVMVLHAAFNSWDNLTPLPASMQLGGQVETLTQVAIAGAYGLLAVALVVSAGRRLGAPPEGDDPTIGRPRARSGKTDA